jgi:hypothetical protein
MSETQRRAFLAACNIARLQAIRYWRDPDWKIGQRYALLEVESTR